MLTSSQAKRPDIAATAAAIHALSSDVVRQLHQMGAVLSAFQAAAEREANCSGGSVQLYWPDLLDVLEQQMPDPQEIERRLRSIAGEFEHAVRAGI